MPDFSRVIRAMARSRVYASPSRDTFHFYLNDNLTTPEITRSPDPEHGAGSTIMSCSASMLPSVPKPGERISGRSKHGWELDHASAGEPHYLSGTAVLRAAQRLSRPSPKAVP